MDLDGWDNSNWTENRGKQTPPQPIASPFDRGGGNLSYVGGLNLVRNDRIYFLIDAQRMWDGSWEYTQSIIF